MSKVKLNMVRRKTIVPRAKIRKIVAEVYAQANLLSAKQLAKLSSSPKKTTRKASTKKAA